MIEHIKQAFENAENNISKLPKWILEMEGMSGKKNRHFYNNICDIGVNYLEVGCWKGSSTCSAIYANPLKSITVIDNFIQWGDVKEEFISNIDKVKGEASKMLMINEDCFKVDVSKIKPVNIFLYDGPHEDKSHARVLKYYDSCLEDKFIFIVDDFSWEHVKEDTYEALQDYNILYSHIIDDDTNEKGWWNGIGVFYLEKK